MNSWLTSHSTWVCLLFLILTPSPQSPDKHLIIVKWKKLILRSPGGSLFPLLRVLGCKLAFGQSRAKSTNLGQLCVSSFLSLQWCTCKLGRSCWTVTKPKAYGLLGRDWSICWKNRPDNQSWLSTLPQVSRGEGLKDSERDTHGETRIPKRIRWSTTPSSLAP